MCVQKENPYQLCGHPIKISKFALRLPAIMSLDEAIEYLEEDELLEVTPVAFRIRKRILNTKTWENDKESKREDVA
jgi:predicted membrane GTPase involved in stress response